jgi:hypothetical protein
MLWRKSRRRCTFCISRLLVDDIQHLFEGQVVHNFVVVTGLMVDMSGSRQDRVILSCILVQAKLRWRFKATAVIVVTCGTTITNVERLQEATEYTCLSMKLEGN